MKREWLGWCSLVVAICGFTVGGYFLGHDKPAAATTGVQTVTVAPSPACSDMARTWQQIALRESHVATLAIHGHRRQAGLAAQAVTRYAHTAVRAGLIRNEGCK